jgi:hypothetical protein
MFVSQTVNPPGLVTRSRLASIGTGPYSLGGGRAKALSASLGAVLRNNAMTSFSPQLCRGKQNSLVGRPAHELLESTRGTEMSAVSSTANIGVHSRKRCLVPSAVIRGAQMLITTSWLTSAPARLRVPNGKTYLHQFLPILAHIIPPHLLHAGRRQALPRD